MHSLPEANNKGIVLQMKDNLILRNAKQKLARFDRLGLRYNLVAKEVYHKRRSCVDPFGRSFLQYIIAGLISFDMGRMMGKGEDKYKMEDDGFGSRLKSKLQEIKPILTPLMKLSLTKIDLQQHKDAIGEAYDKLSANGKGALNANKEHFHVGATKILHFLNPTLFIIVDSNAAEAFREGHNVKFRKSSPGYSAERYRECMEWARRDILQYEREHPEGFEALERGTPITRIYDKLTFITGMDLK